MVKKVDSIQDAAGMTSTGVKELFTLDSSAMSIHRVDDESEEWEGSTDSRLKKQYE